MQIPGQIWVQINKYLPFGEARLIARSLKIATKDDWRAHIHGHQSKHARIGLPLKPDRAYKEHGWVGWHDWLGTANRRGGWRSFTEARSYARSLGLVKASDWFRFCKEGEVKPNDVPTNPASVYADEGWSGWPDWLGVTNSRGQGWLDFAIAKSFVAALGLRSQREWQAWTSGKTTKKPRRPANIPTHPDRTYKAQWTGWSDWLGTKNRRGD